MDLREQLLRHRKDFRFIIGGLVLLLAVCGVIFYLLQRGKGLPAEVAANKLLLFVLWYINVILILTILLVLVRSLFRLLLERHHRILGSKFKTKLVFTAIGLSLIPVLILFPFATRLLLQSFDQWFSLPIEEIVQQADETATALQEQIQDTNKRDAHRVLDELESFDLDDLGQRPILHSRLQALAEEMELHYLALYDRTELIHGIADPTAGFNRAVHISYLSRFLEEAMEKGEATKVEGSLDIEGQLILAACAERRLEIEQPAEIEEAPEETESEDGSEAESLTVIVAGTVLPPEIAERSTSLVMAHQEYLQMAVQKEEVRTVYLLNLMMVTLLVILAFSSIGLRLARRLTAPIQALADGTRRISSGDLDHRVEVAVDDEVGVLVDAFNQMTQELQRNKELVDRSNRELVAANKRIAAVLQNVAAGVVSIDSEGRILTCNGAALEILAQREEDVAGRSILEAWADPERGKLVILLEDDEVAAGHGRQARLIIGGVWKTLEVKVTTLPDTSGQPGARVVVLEDLTELIHAQKMATWNEVARQIAHEIKNPLTPIRLTAERLLRKHRQGDPRLGETLEQGAEVIVREVSSLKNMVDEFSRFARMPRPRPRPVDLDKMLGEILALYQGLKPGIEVDSQVAPAAATVRFDPEQLKSVLINLLDNAMEATDSPGNIRVSTAQNNGNTLLHVADTGRGIPAHDLGKLFLPYYSTKGRGSGLGLAIVHRIVTDHNAAIHVAPNQPKGMVFTLEIPQS
ncbi:MAG: HAMP domain-containing protein [bacterium]|nr:HAMP domain-containing protein [bacterium]